MAALKDQLKKDLVAAMKAHDEIAKSALRMATAAIMEAEVAGESARELTEAEEQKVVAKQVSSRKDSAQAYREGGREELARAEEAEIEVLEKYLPQAMTAQQARAVVDEEVARLAGDQPRSMKLMGPAMKAVQARVQGRYDGGELAAMVRSALS